MNPEPRIRPHVVILGAGFAGLSAVRALARSPVDVTVIDRRNHHVFQPLLYQVASAGLTPADIAWPVRGILGGQANARVLLGTVCGIDTARQRVVLDDGRQEAYDWLIVATGATHNYFGNDECRRHAPGLKQIEDATAIRRRILLAFERAEAAVDAAERARQMTFVVVGGGPTGVEMAGAIAELASHALTRDFRNINPRLARIVLIESGERLLAAFPPSLSHYARQVLERMGVEVQLGRRVTACCTTGVEIGDQCLAATTLIWAAGVAASPAAQWLGAEADRSGRVIVGPDLAVPGQPNILVAGDTAAMHDAVGRPVPGIAPAAKQAGRHAARVIRAALSGRARPVFRYRHYGNLATIGRHRAVIDFGRLRLFGWLAWWVWGVAHIYFLLGIRNRLMVAMQWFYSYLTYGRGARLITGSGGEIALRRGRTASMQGDDNTQSGGT